MVVSQDSFVRAAEIVGVMRLISSNEAEAVRHAPGQHPGGQIEWQLIHSDTVAYAVIIVVDAGIVHAGLASKDSTASMQWMTQPQVLGTVDAANEHLALTALRFGASQYELLRDVASSRELHDLARMLDGFRDALVSAITTWTTDTGVFATSGGTASAQQRVILPWARPSEVVEITSADFAAGPWYPGAPSERGWLWAAYVGTEPCVGFEDDEGQLRFVLRASTVAYVVKRHAGLYTVVDLQYRGNDDDETVTFTAPDGRLKRIIQHLGFSY